MQPARQETKVKDPTKKTRPKILRQKEKFQVWRNVATATAACRAFL